MSEKNHFSGNPGNNISQNADNEQKTLPENARIIGIKKIVTNADGSTTEQVFFGNLPDEENVDRSINIICADDDYLPCFLHALIEGEDRDAVLDPEHRKTFVVTIEETEFPATWVLTTSNEKFALDGYVRDAQHSNSDKMAGQCGEWAKNPDGTMDITGEMLQKDHALARAVVFLQMLKFLKARGLVNELQQSGNRGAMALIEVKDGKPEARIVRGRQRPDLPCTMLFMDEPVMARPYLDELLGGAQLNGMSFEEIEREAEKGDETAVERVAMAYLNGNDGVGQDAEKAAFWFKRLADSGSSTGMFNYGLFCAKGFGVKRDFAEAAAWMRKADEAGDEDAAAFAEKMNNMNRLTALAEQGNAAAQGQLAGLYMELGKSLDQAGPGDDYAMAFKWATKAGEQDDPLGLWALALAYEHGRGVKRNTRMALECYERSANLGFARAKNSLGCFYLRGEVPGHTNAEGFELVKAAAEAGDPEGMANVGNCYQFANGTDHDMDKAIEWYEKALDAGLDNPELAQKVPIYKQLQSIPINHEGNPYEGMNPPIDFKPLSPWEHIEEHMSWQDGDNIQMLGVAKKRRQSGEKPEGFFIDAIKGGVRIIDIEIANTQFQGRVQRIERVREGQAVKIGPCTTRADRLEVFTLDGQSLGELTHGGDFILDVLNEGTGEVTGAKVSYVVPVSKRGPRAKKAELYIDVDLKRTDGEAAPGSDAEDAKAIGDGCVVYHLEGDQTNIWVQKLTVMHLNMSLKRAKGLFELYNRYNDEYAKAAQGDAADTGYAGLSNLVDEIREARRRMNAQAAGGGDYSELENGVVPKGDERYAGIRIKKSAWSDQFELAEALGKACAKREEYYWIDQTRVDRETYEAATGMLSHHYSVMELMDPKNLTFDPNDPEMVSIFGFGKFIAFADLSYGC